jgi:hypothetical protein
VIATVIATMVAATAISGEAVFIVCVVIAGACMASPIARLVAVEVIERLFAAARHRSSVAVAGIIAVVDMAVEVAGAAEPAAGADEHAVVEPIGPVVAVGRAVIWSVVVVAVGTDRLDTEVDGDLGWRYARGAKQGSCENCECEGADFGHDLSLIELSGSSFCVSVGFHWESGRGVVSRFSFLGAKLKTALSKRIIAGAENEKLSCFERFLELETAVSD